MAVIKVGDIYWADIDFTDKSENKLRPVVIIELLKNNDFIYLPLTTAKIDVIDYNHLLISNEDLEIGKIKTSIVLLHKSCVINGTLLTKKQATLNSAGIKKLLKAVSARQTANYYNNVHKPVLLKEFIHGSSKINSRDDIVNHLEASGIQTRMLFAGNLIKHPCFDELRKSGNGFRIVSSTSPTL